MKGLWSMAPTAAKGMRKPIEPRRGGRNSARGEAKRNPWKRFPERLNPEGVTGMWNVKCGMWNGWKLCWEEKRAVVLLLWFPVRVFFLQFWWDHLDAVSFVEARGDHRVGT